MVRSIKKPIKMKKYKGKRKDRKYRTAKKIGTATLKNKTQQKRRQTGGAEIMELGGTDNTAEPTPPTQVELVGPTTTAEPTPPTQIELVGSTTTPASPSPPPPPPPGAAEQHAPLQTKEMTGCAQLRNDCQRKGLAILYAVLKKGLNRDIVETYVSEYDLGTINLSD